MVTHVISQQLRGVAAGMLLILSPSVWAANLALIIGNNQYGNGIDSLANPINDAQAVDAQLKRLGFQTTLVKNADKIQMLEAIDDFSQKINRGDTVLFFYAGHGASANGSNYLIPSKAAVPKNDTFMNHHFVDLDADIASRLSQSPASYKLVVMDACRDNPIARTRSSGTRAFARTDVSQNSAGLSFLYSASKGQQAQDGRGGNSPFTAALIQKLQVPNLTWPQIMESVTNTVRQSTQQQQEVWQEGNPLAWLVLNAQQVEAPKPQVVERVVERVVEKPVERIVEREKIVERDNPHTAEIAAWNAIKNSSRASDYQGFLRSYPSGLFAEAAQLKLKLNDLSPSLPAGVEAQEQAAYIAAYNAYKAGSTQQAILAMEKFMLEYPNSIYFPNSHYWLGEFYLALTPPNFSQAKRLFSVVSTNYPRSARAAAATYRLASIAEIEKRSTEANRLMSTILSEYPNSNEAAYARAFLDKGNSSVAITTPANSDTDLMRQGMWRDPKTNMIWMRCSLGQTWTGTTCTGEASTHNWEAAQDAVAAMNRNGGYGGYTDWVVPHIEDLASLIRCDTGVKRTDRIPAKKGGVTTIQEGCKDGYKPPAIDQVVFPNTPSEFGFSYYWSASPFSDRFAWLVHFYWGSSANNYAKSNSSRVLAVRSGHEQQ